MIAPGFIIAAPRSGAGKTTVTLGLLAALRRRGIAVRAGKSGPDYIDPAFHAAATGARGVNLDSWAMSPPLLNRLFADLADGADLVVIEGSMGLFDGIPGARHHTGATADLAARFGLPVVLVLDVSGQAQTAAAVARGLAVYDEAVRIAGVILNRVASDRHRELVEQAITAQGLPVFGAFPRDKSIALPERHLGLVQAGEHADLIQRLDELAAMAERHVDLDALLAAAAASASVTAHGTVPALLPPGQRIALARDAAFSFIYPHLLAGWRCAGAEIKIFSPLADESPAAECDVCWLPGGYPELHASALAAAHRFHDGLREFAATRPVHGECGGYMVLGAAIIDADGDRHAMSGLLGHTTSFASRRLQLGYREAELLADSPIGLAGTTVRGHEFHYATVVDDHANDTPLAALFDGQRRSLGAAGARRGNVSGTFFHAIAGDAARQ